MNLKGLGYGESTSASELGHSGGLMDTAINFRLLLKWGICWQANRLLCPLSQEGLCCMQCVSYTEKRKQFFHL